MKVLLDQNLDQRLRNHLDPNDVFTASYKGWDALKNGKLLEAAEADGFDILITVDQTIAFEQNLTSRKFAILVLSAVEWRIMKDHLARILAAIDSALPGSLQAVDCGTFSRKKPIRG